MLIRFCDELPHAFGWIVDDEMTRRTSHALVDDGRVWVVDPVDGEGIVDRIRAAGEPAGVIQLLDRHGRDCARLATVLGVEHHVLPRERVGPFELRVVRDGRRWQERALWWPERRTLVVADALGTFGYFLAGRERLGVHPFLRPVPPRAALRGLRPDVILTGHGEGIVEDATHALEHALRTARRRAPLVLRSLLPG